MTGEVTSVTVPINDAMAVVRQIKEFGHARPGYLGLRLEQLTREVAGVLGLRDVSGGIVSSVDKAGPAARAGFREGDVVLQFGARRTTDIRALCARSATRCRRPCPTCAFGATGPRAWSR